MIDIHCHLLPALDDGPGDWDESLAMARLAVAEGTTTIVATPHQLGSYRRNRGETIRQFVQELRIQLQQAAIALEVLPGADVRIESDMISLLKSGDVLSLADRRRHVLLELPHELYFPLEPVLQQLSDIGMTGILTHPERNRGIQANPSIVDTLVDRGCLMQVTAGSFTGGFGSTALRLSELFLRRGLIHLVASDGHGTRSRRPLLKAAREQVAAWTDQKTAEDLFCLHPQKIVQGEPIAAGKRQPLPPMHAKRSWFFLSRRPFQVARRDRA